MAIRRLVEGAPTFAGCAGAPGNPLLHLTETDIYVYEKLYNYIYVDVA
jgi:hypothetical protein